MDMTMFNSPVSGFIAPEAVRMHTPKTSPTAQDSPSSYQLNTIPAKKPGQARAMRASCNACSDAKVKCEKGKPTCTRCAERGQECIYEHSRRIGRPIGRPRKPKLTPSSSESAISSRSTSDLNVNTARQQPIHIPARLNQHRHMDTSRNSSVAERSLTDPNAYPFGFEASSEYPFDTFEPDYSSMDFDFTDLRALPSPLPYTPPLTQSTSLESAQIPSPPQERSSPIDEQCLSPNPGHLPHLQRPQMKMDCPDKQSCDCISRLLSVPGSNDPNFRRTNQSSSTQKIMEICALVLTCSCISYDERAVNLLSFVILHILLQGNKDNQQPLGKEAEQQCNGTEPTTRDSMSMVRELASRLQGCQPGFAKANGNFLLQYWLSTLNS